MTCVERVLAAIRGEQVTPRPSIVWSASPGHHADIVLTDFPNLEETLATHPGQVVLCEVMSPMGRAILLDIDLNAQLQQNPAQGGKVLEDLVLATNTEIKNALDEGAHGIFYRLDGAYPAASTPMEYGGHYLEHDREILANAAAPVTNLLFVEGEGEIYLDFVADLPAELIGWNAGRATVNFHSAQPMCRGKIALDHPEADFFLATTYDEIERLQARAAAQG